MRILLFIFLWPLFFGAQHESPTIIENEEICLSSIENELIFLVNQYRKKNRLKAIPVSSSLVHVAQEHARQMNDEIKEITHSWVECDYDGRDINTYDCMWEMPRRLTGYPGQGYECAFFQEGKDFTATDILEGWQESRAHDNVIRNRGVWKNAEWNAIGVGVNGDYATIWLGKVKDPKGMAKICK